MVKLSQGDPSSWLFNFFCMSPLLLRHLLIFWFNNMLWAALVLSLPQVLNKPFLQRDLVPFDFE